MKKYFKSFLVLLSFVLLLQIQKLPIYASEINRDSLGNYENNADLIEINIDIDPTTINDDIYEVDSESMLSLSNEQYEWKKYATDYYYNKMTTAEQVLYDRLDEMCMEYLTSTNNLSTGSGTTYTPSGESVSSRRAPLISYTDIGLTKAEAQEVFWVFNYSNPQYFFLSNVLGTAISGTDGYVAVYFYDIFSQGTARQQYVSKMQSQISAWNSEIGNPANDYELQKKIHDVICSKVSYEPDSSKLGNPYYQSCVSAICNDDVFSNVTVCAGYTKAFSLFANAYGLETIEVTSASHAWNKVFLFDKWYNVDCTWDDQTSGIIYTFFDKSDSTFVSSGHEPESMWMGYTPSATADFDSSTGIISNFVTQPQITTYTCNGGKMVTINKRKAANQVYYTLDGSEPTTSSLLYTGSFLLKSKSTIKAKEVEKNVGTSKAASLQLDVGAVKEPIISADNNIISLSCATEGVQIYYTTDGSEPTEQSNLYINPFSIQNGQIVKAIAQKRGYASSAVVSNTKAYTTSLGGMCWLLNDTEISVGTAYTTDDPGIQFSWKVEADFRLEWKQLGYLETDSRKLLVACRGERFKWQHHRKYNLFQCG